MNKDKGFWLGGTMMLIAMLALGGWIANVVAIVGSLAAPLTGIFIVRCIGLFVPPLGAVMGYL